MIKRNSTAGRLAQAIYQARMQATDAEGFAPRFPKVAYGDVPSLWVTAALSALEHLEREYGFAPDADRAAANRRVAATMTGELHAKNVASPPPPGSAWSLGYDDHGNRRPERDVLLAIPRGRDAYAVLAQAAEAKPFTSRYESGGSYFEESTGTVYFGPSAPDIVVEDRPETWPVGTPVRVGKLIGKIRHNPPRVRVEFTDSTGAVHHGEFLTKFVHAIPEPIELTDTHTDTNYPLRVRPGDFTDSRNFRNPPSIGIGKAATWCDSCDFYCEAYLVDIEVVLNQGSQHAVADHGHTVTLTRNPEETREPVTL